MEDQFVEAFVVLAKHGPVDHRHLGRSRGFQRDLMQDGQRDVRFFEWRSARVRSRRVLLGLRGGVFGNAIPGLILLQEIGIYDRLPEKDRPLEVSGYSSAGNGAA